MKGLSASDREFLDAVKNIFAAAEVLVVVRYVYGAGRRDFLILKNITEFQRLIGGLRTRDSVVVMKSFQKIKEGKVDEAFIEAAAAIYPTGANWILIGKDNFEYTPGFAYASSDEELRENLQDRLGNHVFIVDEPNYISDDQSVAAYIPDEDGVVRPGAY
jgi:hypothetical protein